MYEREGRSPTSAFERGDTSVAVAEPRLHERTPEERAAGARTIAGNLDNQLELVRTAVATMKTAATARDLAGWTAAKADADQALKQLARIAQKAHAVASDAADTGVQQGLASANHVLDAAGQLVAGAPEAPQAGAPELRCADALLAALPPDPPPATWRDEDFQVAADAVKAVCISQMTASDIATFRVIVTRHTDHVITRRFLRFSYARCRRLLDFLDRDDVKRSARAREQSRRAKIADRAPQGEISSAAEPVSIATQPTASGAADNPIMGISEGSTTTPEASAPGSAAQRSQRSLIRASRPRPSARRSQRRFRALLTKGPGNSSW